MLNLVLSVNEYSQSFFSVVDKRTIKNASSWNIIIIMSFFV